jgi:hypothetical protein
MSTPSVKSNSGPIRIFCRYEKLVDPRTLKLNPANPNTHGQKQTELFGRIFAGNGFRRVITVSRQSGMVVKGNGATLGAIEIGMAKVPIEFQDYESMAAELSDLAADNQLAQLSENDPAKLKELFGELPAEFDKELTGFFDDEIKQLLATSEIEIIPAKIKPVPKMAWALVGVPIQNFGAVQQILDMLPDGAIVHVTASDKGA